MVGGRVGLEAELFLLDISILEAASTHYISTNTCFINILPVFGRGVCHSRARGS